MFFTRKYIMAILIVYGLMYLAFVLGHRVTFWILAIMLIALYVEGYRLYRKKEKLRIMRKKIEEELRAEFDDYPL